MLLVAAAALCASAGCSKDRKVPSRMRERFKVVETSGMLARLKDEATATLQGRPGFSPNSPACGIVRASYPWFSGAELWRADGTFATECGLRDHDAEPARESAEYTYYRDVKLKVGYARHYNHVVPLSTGAERIGTLVVILAE